MAANVGNGALELRDFASVWQPLLALNRNFIGKETKSEEEWA